MSVRFTSGEGTAENAKAIFHRTQFRHSLTIEYHFGLTSSLGIIQEIRGPIQQIIVDPLGISHQVVTQHGAPFPVSHNLGVSHSVVHAGSFGYGVLPFTAVFDSTMTIGQPVYIVSDTNVDLADNVTNFSVIGLANENVSSGASGGYITEGTITLDDWTAVTGTTFLIPGAVYYLDISIGKLTSMPTTIVGQHIVVVARATSNTKIDIEIAEPILL